MKYLDLKLMSNSLQQLNIFEMLKSDLEVIQSNNSCKLSKIPVLITWSRSQPRTSGDWLLSHPGSVIYQTMVKSFKLTFLYTVKINWVIREYLKKYRFFRHSDRLRLTLRGSCGVNFNFSVIFFYSSFSWLMSTLTNPIPFSNDTGPHAFCIVKTVRSVYLVSLFLLIVFSLFCFIIVCCYLLTWIFER